MSNIELSKQEFDGQPLRVAIIDGEPWFATPDVGAALALKGKAVTSDIRSSLSPDEFTVMTRANLETIGNSEGFQLPRSSLSFISESGLYKVILRAHRKDSPRAVRFQDFVTRDLLPNLRKGTLDTDLARKEMGESLAEAVGDKIEVIGTIQSSRAGVRVDRLRDGSLRCDHGLMERIDFGTYAEKYGPYYRCTQRKGKELICGTVLESQIRVVDAVSPTVETTAVAETLPTGFVLFGRPQDVAAAINQLKEEK